MTADDLLKALYSAGIAALGLVSIVLGVLARYAPEMIRTFLEGRKLVSLERAGSLAAQATEERARTENWSSEAKQDNAQQVLRSIAPVAAKSVGSVEIADAVRAGVAKMRASVPTPEALAAAVRIASSAPPAIPPPPRMPKEPHEA